MIKAQEKTIAEKDEEIQRLKRALKANNSTDSDLDVEASTPRVKVDHSRVKEDGSEQVTEFKLDADSSIVCDSDRTVQSIALQLKEQNDRKRATQKPRLP